MINGRKQKLTTASSPKKIAMKRTDGFIEAEPFITSPLGTAEEKTEFFAALGQLEDLGYDYQYIGQGMVKVYRRLSKQYLNKQEALAFVFGLAAKRDKKAKRKNRNAASIQKAQRRRVSSGFH